MGQTTRYTNKLSFAFQSTHPLRDGTNDYGCKVFDRWISIHPSLAGWDENGRNCMAVRIGFQSTHPLRDGTVNNLDTHTDFLFQSTHPLRDGTPKRQLMRRSDIFQSTHPLRDGTFRAQRMETLYQHFNPPIPCGMGPLNLCFLINSPIFQSTHPLRDGTISKNLQTIFLIYFNPPIPCGMGLYYLD